jgi:PAS domain S-box-containing protein
LRVAYLRKLLALALLYWLMAHLGLRWAAVSGAGSPVWPAAGLGLAGLLLFGRSLWPAVFAGRLLAAWTSGSEQPLWADMGLAGVNAAATLLAATVVTRFGRLDFRLSTLRDINWLIAGCLVVSLAAAIPGTLILASSSGLSVSEAARVFRDWLYGNFGGAITLTPLILAWASLRLQDLTRTRLMHLAVCIVAVAVGCSLVFFTDKGVPLRTWHTFPLLVWAAVAFQARGASISLLVASALAIAGVSFGLGPFVELAQTLTGQLSYVQQFIGLTSVTMLMLAGAVDERRIKETLEREVASRTAAEARVRAIVNSAVDAIAVIDEHGIIQDFNPAAETTFGYVADDAVGRDISMLMPDEHAVAHSGYIDAYKVPGEAKIIGIGREVVGRRKDGSTFPLDLSIAEWFDASGTRYFTGIMRDITERRKAEERERLLAREVDHRAKNLLAVAQSVVRLSHADSVTNLKKTISGRVQALGRAHSLLAASRWEGADLKTLLCDEITPFTGKVSERIDIGGPEALLRPTAAQVLGMVFHELTTNAVKYGSLSDPNGRLRVEWTIRREAREAKLMLRWEEIGGPPVAEPQKLGFGSTVITSSIESQLEGEVNLRWLPGGLVCEVSIPATDFVISGADTAVAEAFSSLEDTGRPCVRGSRILVLEDEKLIAIEIEGTLRAAGCVVLGPASRVHEALELLKVHRPDAALLDVNVAGEMSYPVADALLMIDVPFAFVTGYAGSESLPEHFRSCAVVTKPFAASDLIMTVGRLRAGTSRNLP